MTKYLISFPASAMDVAAEDMPAVSEASHSVIRDAKRAGVYVFGGGLDAQRVGQLAHPPGRPQRQLVERVHLALLDAFVAVAVEPFQQATRGGAATDLAPREGDANRQVVDLALTRVGRDVAHRWG